MVAPGVGLQPVVLVAGMTALSFLTAAAVSVAYRWYVRDRIPAGVALLAGVSVVALYLNTRGALGQVVAGETGYLAWNAVVFNSIAFLLAGLVTAIGRGGGDRLAMSAMAMAGTRIVEGEVSGLVSRVGRLVSVTLPETIHDIDGYDPVSEAVKTTLAGRTLLFPRRGSRAELETRLRARLKDDYDVGYVDVDLATDGTVEYLALGRRVAGIGPTLGPGAGVVAVEADPPNAASAGDAVQLWETGERTRRVATGEVRGVADDVVTLALDEQDARAVAGNRYRLLTLPDDPTVDREFATLLRAAEETMAAIQVSPGSALLAETVGDLGATVVAVKPAEGSVEPVPVRDRSIDAGDLVYVVGSPAAIRQLEERAAGT